MQTQDSVIEYLQKLYHGVQIKHAQNTMDETYGEILPFSVTKLINFLNLQPTDHFVDLGSGLGKIILQLTLQTNIQQLTGIEIVPELHIQANNALLKMQTQMPEVFKDRKISLLNDNFLKMNLPDDCTHVLIASPCFSTHTLNKLTIKLNNLASLKSISTLKALPAIQHHRFHASLRLECSWDSALCFVYHRIAKS